MLKIRLIPVLLLKNGRMVKTINFNKLRDVGNPVTAAKIYNAQSADELIFLDILASKENRGTLINTIDRVTEECFMPFGVGGGVKSLADIKTLLKAGADKISINTAAVENPDFIKEASEKFGSANIMVSIDYKKVNGKNKVFIRGGSKKTNLDPISWAIEAEKLGAGEILLNSIDRDGTMKGYDIKTIKAVAKTIKIPLIACGGAGTLQDFVEAVNLGGASAVAAGSIFHFTDQSPIKARFYMKEAGLNIRYGV